MPYSLPLPGFLPGVVPVYGYGESAGLAKRMSLGLCSMLNMP
jgi:hypothetical protein